MAPMAALTPRLPRVCGSGFGRIINVASAHGKVASLNKSAYVASKHAVVGFTKATALEAAGTGVTAVTVCPGWVLTPLVQKQVCAAVHLPSPRLPSPPSPRLPSSR